MRFQNHSIHVGRFVLRICGAKAPSRFMIPVFTDDTHSSVWLHEYEPSMRERKHTIRTYQNHHWQPNKETHFVRPGLADESEPTLWWGGIISKNCGTKLDHGVLLVGYGTDRGPILAWLSCTALPVQSMSSMSLNGEWMWMITSVQSITCAKFLRFPMASQNEQFC